MPIIHLTTSINAGQTIVFDLTRSIEVHVASTAGTSERAIGGVMTGLISEGQSVTWEARHFGFKHHMTVRITQMKRPESFEDEMVSGAFKRMHHRHEFRVCDGGVVMIDIFDFLAPFGPFGRVAEAVFLTAYMRRLLVTRAREIKRIAESGEYGRYLLKPGL